MKKMILVAVSCVVAMSVGGTLGFLWATELASEHRMQEFLRQAARELYVLEKAKSIVGDTASLDEIRWLNKEIDGAERVLSYDEFAEFVKQDQMIKRHMSWVEELRKKSGG